MDTQDEDAEVVWNVGVFDAHCHPTDIMASTADIAKMKARVLTVMSTRSQDQKLVQCTAQKYPIANKEDFSQQGVSHVVPAFGWHPWMSHELYDDRGSDTELDVVEHYKSVLVPPPEDLDFLKALPPPTSISQYLRETEARLVEFPLALVGEVGLDRAFRLPDGPAPKGSAEERSHKSGGSLEEYTGGSREGRPLSPYRVSMEHQKAVLRAQLDLAAKTSRAVSLHSVQAHGVVFDLIQGMWKGHEKPSKRQTKRRQSVTNTHASEFEGNVNEDQAKQSLPYPPRICMHSYSGPPDALKQFLNPKVPTDFYFSFSTAINFNDSHGSAEKVISVIKQVPDDRILIESDLHCAGELMDSLLKEIVLKVCEIKEWSLSNGAERLKQNWIKFIFG